MQRSTRVKKTLFRPASGLGITLALCFFALHGDGCGPFINENLTGSITLSNSKNQGTLQSGFLVGTSSAVLGSVASIEVSVDGGSYQSATGTTSWKFQLPHGSSTWKLGSSHTVGIRSKNSSSQVLSTLSVTLKEGINKDVNGDGYPDVVVGAPSNQGSGQANKGSAYVFYGGASSITSHAESAVAYTCSGYPDCTVIQNPDNENSGYFGRSVATTGDVNGDGYADVIVGAYMNQGSGQTDKGSAYVFYGGASGITSHAESAVAYTCSGYPDCTVIQNPDDENSGWFGYSVATAGDVNGDGYADVIVGAHFNQGSGQSDKGSAYIFYGGASGTTSHPESAVAYTCTGYPDCTVIQNPDNENIGFFGWSVATAGDVNGDGYVDVIVGANRNQGSGQTNKGSAYVFYGGASGITSHPESAVAYTCTGYPDCTVIQNPDDENGGFFGLSVATAGDVNGDGYADVIVGAIRNQGSGQADKGSAYVFYGGASGITSHLESAVAYTCLGYPDCTVIQNPDDENGGNFGESVATAGDVNGDGYADVIVGAYQNQGSGQADKGSSYVFYGGATGITSHLESAVAYTCSGYPDCTVIQNPDDENSGWFGNSVAMAGDVNGDGYADVIVGAHFNQGSGAANKGSAYVFYGGASGITSHPESAVAYTCSGYPDCTVIQNPDDENSGFFGYSVATAGDVNGDSYADVIVGAHLNQGSGQANKGSAYAFYGGGSAIPSHLESAVAYTCLGCPDYRPNENIPGKTYSQL